MLSCEDERKRSIINTLDTLQKCRVSNICNETIESVCYTNGKKRKMELINIFAVGAGGFLGAVLRFLIGCIHLHESFQFPIKTFFINIIGCIAIGTITVLAAKNQNLSSNMILFLKVGLCGGFTTFSTFALETADLIKAGQGVVALIYMLLSMAVGILVIFAVEYILALN